eukprot:12308832-Karenia_brevis.AAC.1
MSEASKRAEKRTKKELIRRNRPNAKKAEVRGGLEPNKPEKRSQHVPKATEIVISSEERSAE